MENTDYITSREQAEALVWSIVQDILECLDEPQCSAEEWERPTQDGELPA